MHANDLVRFGQSSVAAVNQQLHLRPVRSSASMPSAQMARWSCTPGRNPPHQQVALASSAITLVLIVFCCSNQTQTGDSPRSFAGDQGPNGSQTGLDDCAPHTRVCPGHR